MVATLREKLEHKNGPNTNQRMETSMPPDQFKSLLFIIKANPYIGLSLSRMKFGVSSLGRRGMHDKPAFNSRYNQLYIFFGSVSVGCCELTTEQQAIVVKEVADSELPPRAPYQQLVRQNCQLGWTVRVIT